MIMVKIPKREGESIMGTSEILFTALFCFSMVFSLLGVTYVLVKLSTSAVRIIESKAKNNSEEVIK